jgi:hypothetical protein
VELRHQASSLSNPWVVARNESGPRYSPRAPIKRALGVAGSLLCAKPGIIRTSIHPD